MRYNWDTVDINFFFLNVFGDIYHFFFFMIERKSCKMVPIGAVSISINWRQVNMLMCVLFLTF